MAKSIFELSTKEPDKNCITIDGEDYPVKSIDNLELSETLRLVRDGSKLMKFFQKLGNLSESEVAESMAEFSDEELDNLAGVVEKLAAMVLEAPDEVMNRLNSIQKARIIQAVLTEPAVRMDGPELTEKASSLSPGSNGSTGEILETG